MASISRPDQYALPCPQLPSQHLRIAILFTAHDYNLLLCDRNMCVNDLHKISIQKWDCLLMFHLCCRTLQIHWTKVVDLSSPIVCRTT